MDEQQMRAECAKIADKWCAGGLAGGSIYEDFAVELAKRVQAAERERCAQYLRDAAARLAPDGKRTNQVDRHTAHVLATKGDELAHGCHVRAERWN